MPGQCASTADHFRDQCPQDIILGPSIPGLSSESRTKAPPVPVRTFDADLCTKSPEHTVDTKTYAPRFRIIPEEGYLDNALTARSESSLGGHCLYQVLSRKLVISAPKRSF